AGDGVDLAAEVFRHALAPDLRAVGNLDADQIALAAEAVHQLAVHRRRGVGPAAPGVGLEVENGADLRRPRLLALVIDRQEVFRVLARPHEVEPAADDRRPGVAGAGALEGPDQPGAALRPALKEAGLPGDAGAVGPAPLGPVGRRQRHREG